MRLSGSRSWSVVGALTRGRSKQQYSILIRSRTFNITPASVISSPQYTFDTSNRWLSSSKHGHVVEHHPHYPNHHHPLQQTADANNIHDLIESWQYTYRIPINTIFQAILEDKSYQEVVKSKMLDTSNWENFANNSRRVLVKDPYHFFHQSNEKVIDMKHRLESAFININIDEVGTSSSSFQACKDYLFQIILSRAEVELHEIIKANHVLAQTSDLSLPHEWYPYARLTKRKIIYHGGPTNSGKTYHAIQRLKQADPNLGGGLYCGPLRLLALEIYEQLNRQGVSCDLMTGQEKREVPGSTHISCTIEMVSSTREYDVAVVDEIQMIADRDRGHSWTKALLGLRAREIHLCGGLEASHLVESLCKSTDDEFELIRYDRLSTLQIEEESLRGDYSKIQPGDCIVAFSIADIFSIRREIEKYTKHKCAVIYGQLPSETRSTQARLFNDDNSGYDVLVASDAIGMGLNLNIRRIVFHTSLKKFGSAVDGSYFIEPSHIKQIAGRAGRKSSNYPIGYVTTWQEIDLAYVKAVMKWDIPQIKSAGVFPSVDQIKVFYEQVKAVFAEMTPSLPLAGEKPALIQSNENENATTETAVTPKKAKEDSSKGKKGKTGAKGKDDEEDDQSDKYVMEAEFKRNPDFMRLSMIVDRFVQLSKVDSRYFMCDHASLVTSSNWLHTIPLSIEDRFTFANAPVNFGYPLAMKSLYCYAAMYAAKRPVPLDIRLSKSLPGDLEEFADLCTRHNIIDLYLWLSFRFPKYFIEREHCLRLKNHAIRQIEKTLSTQNLQNSYSFRDSYADLRRKMQRKGEQSTLPPLQFGEELRETTRRNIAAIPIADWYVVSENGEPSMISSHPQRRRSFEGQHKDKHGVTRKHGHKSGGDESGSNADSSVSTSSIPEGVKKEEGTKIIDQSL